MSILSKTSNLIGTKYSKLEDYVKALDNDIRQLFHRFSSLFSVRAINVGSEADYISINSSGSLSRNAIFSILYLLVDKQYNHLILLPDPI